MPSRYTAQEMREMAIEAEVIEVADQFYGHDMDTIAAMLHQAADAMEREKLMEAALHDAITDVCNDCQYSEDNGLKCANADRDCYVIKWRSILANGSGEVSNV